jgi:hypothetical protein
MAGPVGTLKAVSDGACRDADGGSNWIHLIDARKKCDIRALTFKQFKIPFRIARVTLEVLAFAELLGIDENADDHDVRGVTGTTNE